MLSQPNPTTDCKECFKHGLVLEFNSCAGYDRSIKDTEHHMDSVTQEMPPFGLKGRLAGIGSDLGGRNADIMPSGVRKCNWIFCDICGASFTEQKNMSRHRKKHTEVASYTCPICGKNLSRQDSLVRHLQICKLV